MKMLLKAFERVSIEMPEKAMPEVSGTSSVQKERKYYLKSADPEHHAQIVRHIKDAGAHAFFILRSVHHHKAEVLIHRERV